MAVAHGKDNIRINCICHGTVQTEVWEPMIEWNPRILDEITPWYPLGCIGKTHRHCKCRTVPCIR